MFKVQVHKSDSRISIQQVFLKCTIMSDIYKHEHNFTFDIFWENMVYGKLIKFLRFYLKQNKNLSVHVSLGWCP